MAVRAAVGAAMRIFRQLVTESIVLTAFGGALGLALAKAILTVALPQGQDLEPAVIGFLLMICLVPGIVIGLAPALQALRLDPQSVIKSAALSSSGSAFRSTDCWPRASSHRCM
jgi:putative ABC transport system permease protein